MFYTYSQTGIINCGLYLLRKRNKILWKDFLIHYTIDQNPVSGKDYPDRLKNQVQEHSIKTTYGKLKKEIYFQVEFN